MLLLRAGRALEVMLAALLEFQGLLLLLLGLLELQAVLFEGGEVFGRDCYGGGFAAEHLASWVVGGTEQGRAAEVAIRMGDEGGLEGSESGLVGGEGIK